MHGNLPGTAEEALIALAYGLPVLALKPLSLIFLSPPVESSQVGPLPDKLRYRFNV